MTQASEQVAALDVLEVRPCDVIVNSNDRTANKLLHDLLCLNFGTLAQRTETETEANAKAKANAKPSQEEKCQRMVEIMTQGIDVTLPPQEERVPVPFLKGTAIFYSSDSTKVLSHEEALEYVETLMDEEVKRSREELERMDLPTATCTDSSKESQHTGAMDTTTATTTTETMPGGASLTTASLDVQLYPRDTNEPYNNNYKGNRQWVQYVENVLAAEPISLASTSSSRVALVRSILDNSIASAKSDKPRFLLHDVADKWTELSYIKAAEFTLSYVFDKLVEQETIALQAAVLPPVTTMPSEDLSPPDDLNKPGDVPIEKPDDCDVLFGRGGMTNNHPGNRRFRDIISLHRPDYVRAIKIEKPNVARRIVAAIRGGNPPGRFLKKESKDQKWYDVGNRHATEKTSQALREKTLAEKNGKVTTEGDIRKRLLEQALYEARITRMRLSKEGSNLPAAYLDPSAGIALPPLGQPNYLPLSTGPSFAPIAPYITATTAHDDPNFDHPHIDAITAEEMKKIQKQKEELAQLASQNDQEDPPTDNRGVLDNDGNMLVTENDILCGRGGLTNHHKGNKRFRDIVALHRPDYVRAAKIHKPGVARLIVRAIRNSDPPGRFLKKDSKSNKFYDIGDKRAAEKASQALREKSPEERVPLTLDGPVVPVDNIVTLVGTNDGTTNGNTMEHDSSEGKIKGDDEETEDEADEDLPLKNVKTEEVAQDEVEV